MEVLRVLVQYQATKLLHRELRSRPHLCDVEGVETKLLWIRVLGLHDLHVGPPADLFAVLDCLVQIALGVVRIFTAHLCGLLLRELFLAVLCDEMVFDVNKLALCVDPLESVATVAVIETPTLRSAVVAKEHETSVVALRSVAEQVEDTVIVEEEVLGIAILRSDDIGTLNGISAEKDGEVQPYDVVVALYGVEFDGETARVAGLIRKFSSGRYGRETDEDGCLLADRGQEVRLGEVEHVFGGLKISECSRTARMHHALQILGTIEGLLFLEEEDVAGDGNTSNCFAVLWVGPWDTLIIREVSAIVLALAALHSSRNLCDNVGWSLIRALHVAHAGSSAFAHSRALDGHGSGLKRMLEGVILVCIRAGA